MAHGPRESRLEYVTNKAQANKNQTGRSDKRESKESAIRISLPSIDIKERERSSTQLARQLIS